MAANHSYEVPGLPNWRKFHANTVVAIGSVWQYVDLRDVIGFKFPGNSDPVDNGNTCAIRMRGSNELIALATPPEDVLAELVDFHTKLTPLTRLKAWFANIF